jgi:hypothetical protein
MAELMDGLDASVVWWLFAVSLVMLIASPLAVGWFVVRLPKDYFTAPRRKSLASLDGRPLLRLFVVVAKNLVGVLLVAAGLLMLVVPGQGVLTIAVGVLLLDFPGKFRLERWLVTRPAVWRSINWLRKRAGRAELERPKSHAIG